MVLIGKWKNIEELEESIGLDELQLLINAAYKIEHRNHRFMAALKGVKLDDPDEETAKEKWERAEKKAAAILAGMNEEEYANHEETESLQSMGFSVMTG